MLHKNQKIVYNEKEKGPKVEKKGNIFRHRGFVKRKNVYNNNKGSNPPRRKSTMISLTPALLLSNVIATDFL